MTIGFAVFIHKGKSSATTVVEDKPTDDDTMRQIKELIRAMTPSVSEQRFAAPDMAETLNILLGVGIIACFLPKMLKSTSEIVLWGIRNNCQS